MSRYLVRPLDRATFSQDQATKSDLVRGNSVFVGLNCFEPGQTQRIHSHRGADKFYLVLSGKARMVVGDERFEATAGSLVWAPADVPHGVETAVERTVMVIAMAPPPTG